MAPAITSPTPGATLDGSIQKFDWDLGGIPIQGSWIYVGSTVGGSQYLARSVAAVTTTSAGDLPTDGSTVHVRIWYRTGGAWLFIDEQYRAAMTPGLPAFTRPGPGGQLDGESHRFEWNFNRLEVESSWLYLGGQVAGSEYGALFTGTATSITANRLPIDDSTVYARLYFQVGGIWYFIDSTFEAGSVAVPTIDELTRELQRLVGVAADGIVGPRTRAALNRNWAGRRDSFDPSFAARLTNDRDVVLWIQRRLNTRARLGLELNGAFDEPTEAAVTSQLDRGGVVAAESFLALLEP